MKTQTLYCEVGRHNWERESRQGTRPRICDDCRSNGILMALYRSNPDKAAEVAQESLGVRAAQQIAVVVADLDGLREEVRAAEQHYVELFKAAVNTRETELIDRAFDRADRAQKVLIYKAAELRSAETTAALA